MAAAVVLTTISASAAASSTRPSPHGRAAATQAFEPLHARWAQRVLRFATSRLGSREDAEDVMQEVFLAFIAARALRGPSSFGTWLLGIASI